VSTRPRVDAELVRRGLARSREQAARLVLAGRVRVAGHPIDKPAHRVDPDDELLVDPDPNDPGYASRAGHKLAGALEALGPRGLTVRGRCCLDVGASTGGFTDVLLRAGATRVTCLDVGHGQLVPRLRADSRTVVMERRNVRDLTRADLDGPVDLVVADLSFISLVLVLPVLADVAGDEADLLLMVKPQFEVGRDRLGSGGVVRRPEWRAEAVRRVAAAADALGWGAHGVVPSPLPGPSGNVEFFLWLRRGTATVTPETIDRTVAGGPGGEKVAW
jgi:23S rRNA (cytidine1920-2'-O)/16S rRNA (cytidine1409-2'-O)-methyltransferase